MSSKVKFIRDGELAAGGKIQKIQRKKGTRCVYRAQSGGKDFTKKGGDLTSSDSKKGVGVTS